MRMPDFLVVGAARAGTTTLHSYLRQHPEIYLSGIKEPCFFAFEGEEIKYVKGKFAFAVKDFVEYEKLFREARADQKIGEVSTPYLYLYDKTIESIKRHFQSYDLIKIVILLRNPAERAFSQYCWRLRDGREPLSFVDAINAETERMKENYSFDYFYLDRGYYYKQVKAYLESFKHVHVILFEDFEKEPQNVLRNLCKFLEVDSTFNFRILKPQNESSLPKSKSLGRLVTTESKLKYKMWYKIPDQARKRIRKVFSELNAGRKISLDNSMRIKLNELYREDILSLQKLIGRNLTHWLE